MSVSDAALQAASLEIVPDGPAYAEPLTRVLDAAFGPGRHAKTSERVRERGALAAPELSRVALWRGEPIGCCRIWRVRVGARPAVFLGPLAVLPAHQHGGLGARLVRASLQACLQAGEAVVILVGAQSFFGPLGFQPVPAGLVSLPGPVDPKRLLWHALKPSAFEGMGGPLTGFRAASST